VRCFAGGVHSRELFGGEIAGMTGRESGGGVCLVGCAARSPWSPH
jgi:hypothetical protein